MTDSRHLAEEITKAVLWQIVPAHMQRLKRVPQTEILRKDVDDYNDAVFAVQKILKKNKREAA